MTKNSPKNKAPSDTERLVVATALDIKAPLGLISAMASHLRTGNLSPKEQEQVLARLELMCDLVIDSVEGLLITAQAQTQQALDQEPVSVGAVIEETMHRYDPLAKAYGQELRLRRPRSLPPVVANKTGIAQVLSRVLELAIRGSRESSKIQIKAKTTGELVRTTISDGAVRVNGEALPSTLDLVGKILQPSPAVATSGSGIFIADQLGHLMGGRFGAENNRGKSGLFLELPAAQQMLLL